MGVLGDCVGDNLAGKGVRPWRFLLSQEWSTGERESIGEYGIVAAIGGFYAALPPFIVRFLLSQEWSCGGRGIYWRILAGELRATMRATMRGNCGRILGDSPFPHKTIPA